MRFLKAGSVVFFLIVLVYLAGPNPSTPHYQNNLPAVPSSPAELQRYIDARENSHHLKPGNQAEIVWNDSTQQKTRYAIVYLHGFSASKQEGNPVHLSIARKFGCNLYLSRLSQHGIDTTDAMANLTAENLWESAKEALAIGMQLGDSVILMGTSTGGSLAIHLAAHYPSVAALVLMSPNIEINDANAWLLNNPWGLQIARLVKGSSYNQARNDSPAYKKYWYYQYRLEAAVQLEEYLETAMTKETFSKVHQPVLALYYYKNSREQDPVVKVSAIKEMMNELQTPAPKKVQVAIPNAENHVLGSYVVSKDIPAVEQAIASFLQPIVH